MIRTHILINAQILTLALAVSAFTLPSSAQAQNTLTIMLNEEPQFAAVPYACEDGTQINVTYVNTSYQSFALLPVDGIETLFVSVITGSGVRYVNDIWEWSTQADEAMLTNLLTQADPQRCSETGN